MSATLTKDVGEVFHVAYRAGWSSHAAATGASDHVNTLLAGDTPESVVTNTEGQDFGDIYETCRSLILAAISVAPALRRGAVLESCASWEDLVRQVDSSCSRMHDLNASGIDGFRVSVGLVRMTRISHTAALFHQLDAGDRNGRLRVKLCLHSNFPRLHRSWVEDRLKRALTRNRRDPQTGLRSLCHAEDLFRRADAIGSGDIEIVCVTSPVIETGNDLDFDYAILDPVSMRSIVQAAGRVRRHRPGEWSEVNTLILDRSPIAMQGERLAMPGVETDTPKDTGVSRGNLSGFPERRFRDLAGDLDFGRITAGPILSDGEACPLRDEEAKLRRAMMALSGENAPLGRYLGRPASRLNARFTKTRMFRRSTTQNIRYMLVGENFEDAAWQVDLNPGGKTSSPVIPSKDELSEMSSGSDDGDGHLFTDILARAWSDFSGGLEPISAPMLRRLVSVDIPDYGSDKTVIPTMTFAEQTGFTRNFPKDLLGPFGKAKREQ